MSWRIVIPGKIKIKKAARDPITEMTSLILGIKTASRSAVINHTDVYYLVYQNFILGPKPTM